MPPPGAARFRGARRVSDERRRETSRRGMSRPRESPHSSGVANQLSFDFLLVSGDSPAPDQTATDPEAIPEPGTEVKLSTWLRPAPHERSRSFESRPESSFSPKAFRRSPASSSGEGSPSPLARRVRISRSADAIGSFPEKERTFRPERSKRTEYGSSPPHEGSTASMKAWSSPPFFRW